MTLPILVSLPHAGLTVPEFLRHNCQLTNEQIVADGDEYAEEIYAPLKNRVAEFITTDIARAVLDMNRAEDDIRKDGVVKTHSCWDLPIWRHPLDETAVGCLINTYHRPYHQRLSAVAGRADIVLAVDCHTMAEHGPPVGPDPGAERPQVCIGDDLGRSCPQEWVIILQRAFKAFFPGEVSINRPFSGGYITRHHGQEMPWIQIELSRGDFADAAQKSRWVRSALATAMGIIADRT